MSKSIPLNKLVSAAKLEETFSRRSFAIGAGMGGLGMILAARMGYIAIAENERYTLESESNRVNLSLIPPRRGWILDRNQSSLALNKSDFRVDVIPERIDDIDATIAQLGEILRIDEASLADISKRVAESPSFQPIEVASGLDYEQFAALSVRLPDLPGVVPQRGFSRDYPTGSSVGHLLGYLGPANAEEYELDRNPLLVTPGFKIGKDGLEKQFETELRGEAGARRVEVTASGRVVRALETRDDIPGKPISLTIDGPLQDYAARRIGLESGSVVVMDCETGDLLCMASMPSFDPNSFSSGIGRIEYAMLREDERVPLRNKVLKGLYPPASTVKPMVSMALLREGVDPEETVFCGGGLRVGDRFFRCHARRGHGNVNMNRAIAQSCDVYFYALAQRVGMDPIAEMNRRCGLGQEFPLPVTSQFYGTVPDPEWKVGKFKEPWFAADTVNATIGQGYMLANPLQLAISSARLATGRRVMPRLTMDTPPQGFEQVDFPDEHVNHVRQAMSDVVNGAGTARRARLPVSGIKMAGKTGTAQVVGLTKSDGRTGPWKFRDHGLFTFFAPFDKPKYAGAVVIEHGGGSGSAYPIARDVVTFLFDPAKGLQRLRAMERRWGGTAQQRLAKSYAAFAEAAGEVVVPVPARTEEIFDRVDAEARVAAQQSEDNADQTIVPRAITSSATLESTPASPPATSSTSTPNSTPASGSGTGASASAPSTTPANTSTATTPATSRPR
jgi:penicillin-binding protein 2